MTLEELSEIQNLILLERREAFVHRLGSFDQSLHDLGSLLPCKSYRRANFSLNHWVLLIFLQHLVLQFPVHLIFPVLALLSTDDISIIPLVIVDLLGVERRNTRNTKLV